MINMSLLFSKKTLDYSDSGGFSTRQNLFDCIEHGNIDDIDRVLEAYLVHLYALVKDDIGFAKEIIHYVWAQLNFVVVRGGIKDEEARAIHQKYYTLLEYAMTPEALIDLSKEQILEFTYKIAEKKTQEKYSLLIRKCCSFVQNNIYEKITPSEVAEAMHFSRTYVAHKFKEEVGMTLTQYIRKVKIDEAKRLIDTNVPFSYIAQNLGFASQSHFSEIFKSETGMTPNQYKQLRQ